MGHITNHDREYRLLQERLDCNVTGAPDSPVFVKILQLLFSPEEAKLARQIPVRPTLLSVLSRKLAIPEDELSGRLSEMAGRGLVFDVEHKGQRYVVLAPVVIGFFEFTFMRTRDDLPLAELARLFDIYMNGEDDRFARSVFHGTTQIGRSLVREEALPEGDFTEILDWERASYIVKSASTAGVSLCACRHKAEHLGKVCGNALRTCLTLNSGAEVLIKNGLSERISTEQAMRILQECKEAGLAQTADNVQKDVGYICNCCSCCCGMFQAIKTFNIRNAVVSSNWIAEIDASTCRGCGACVNACPVGAIIVVAERVDEAVPNLMGNVETPERSRGKGQSAVCEESMCLGCGVCYSACKFGSIKMKPRPRRVFTPETTFDKIVAMAVERGKLSHLLFDDPFRLSHRALGRIVSVLEKSPPFKAVMAVESVRSVFLRSIVKGAKKLAKE